MLDDSGDGDSQYGDLDDDDMLLATTETGDQSKNNTYKADKASNSALRDITPHQRRHSNAQNTILSIEASKNAHQGGASCENIHDGKTHQAELAQQNCYALKTSKSYQLVDVDTATHNAKSKMPTPVQPDDEVEDIPSDAFDSSPPAKEVRNIGIPKNGRGQTGQDFRPQYVGHRQTTLLGGIVSHTQQPASQPRRAWPMANREEAPTHHSLDEEAMKTWIYPRNLGVKRDYQFNIVHRGLFHNLLVALPTGLGKTFIAATVMLNWYRWTKDAQIVFVAPTKPLVAQQIQACFNIVGIPRSQTTMMTGNVPPGLRTQEWTSKRVFFMTPQTFINDLKTGICDPKRVILVVVDEAHRATGGYSYVEVIKFIRRFNSSFRVLALTATPGASIEQVQQVIDGLDISRVEIRTETDLDIRKFVHQRNIEIEIFEASEQMELMKSLFSKVLQPSLDKLRQQNATWTKDPMFLSPFMLTNDRVKWAQSDAGRKASMGVKGMMNAIFTVLASLAHAIILLNFHGIGPFYQNLLSFRKAIEDRNGKGGKYAKQINDSDDFNELMSKAKSWMESPDFLGHPKLEYLQRVVLNHFIDAGDGKGAADGRPPSQTRIMVFVQFRDSADEVVRILKKHEPMIRPHVFVGQAASKNSEGMDQKRQLQVIADFQRGVYNTLVATSIGEEGLDIGEVDLIICYDASASPVRMLQRMGRTGRKRAGKIVLLLMRGKEEDQFARAKDNYEKMQLMIADGQRFQFHEDLSPRILPRTVQPELDERMIEIPIENTQADLPEPKKRGKVPKRPPKKFNMPDGVRTGFTKASRLNSGADFESEEEDALPVSQTAPQDRIRIPDLDKVLLTASEDRQLERLYQNVGGDEGQTVPELRLDTYPERQRVLGRVDRIPHGRYTKRIVRMLNAIHETDLAKVEDFEANFDSDDVKSVTAEETMILEAPARVDSTFQKQKSGPPKASRSTHKLVPRISETQLAIEVRSSRSDETDDEMDDFIVDDEDVIGVPSSLASSPPSMKPRQKRRRLARQSPAQSSDSDEEIPDISSLFRTRPPDPGKTPKVRSRASGDRLVAPLPSQKRSRKILEDSDDE